MKKTFKINSKFKKGNLFYEMLSQKNTLDQNSKTQNQQKKMKKMIKEHLIEKNKHFECPNRKQCFICLRDRGKKFQPQK